MKLAVTGATGFIGSHVAGVLRAHGHDVRALSRSELDLANRPFDAEQLAGLDGVVHCAAYLPASYTDPAEAKRCMDLNALGTLALLQACVHAGVPRVVHLSTNLYRLSATAVTEDAPFEPSPHASYYLVSKAAADFFAGHFRDALAVSIVRLGSVYGPGLRRGVISAWTRQLLAGETISVEDGRYQSDLVHVGDVAHAIAAALERNQHGAFNLGSGVATRPLDIAEALLAAVGVPRERMQVVAAESGELRGFCALDSSRARSLLGFAPRALLDGLREYVARIRSTP